MIRALALSLVLTSCAVQPAFAGAVAQLTCGPRDKIEEVVGNTVGANKRLVGIAGNGSGLIEVVIGDNGRYAILLTTKDTGTCIFASGDDIEEMEPMPFGDPA